MRVLVTGGAGFIGTNFVLWLLHTVPDVRVTVLDAMTSAVMTNNFIYARRGSREDSVWERFEFVHGDVRDRDVLFPLVKDSDVVVHLAAESHNDWSLEHPDLFVDTNVMGTLAVLEAVRHYGVRLHHVSTDEVFGDLPLDSGVFTATSPYRPSSPYSASKAGADHLVRAWTRSFDLPVTLSIASNNYGPYQHIEKFIPRQVTELLEGRPMRLYGSGVHVRDWIHVSDHCRALWAIVTGGELGKTYLIGGACEVSNSDIAALVLDQGTWSLPASEAVVHVADRPGHDVRYALDSRETTAELGWAPNIPLAQGIRDTITWYTNNRAWWQEAKAATEQRYRARGQ